jgi:SAM-dependent methyltransferase
MGQPHRATARALAKQYLAKGDPFGWFDELYARAKDNPDIIPWAELRPNPHLIEWLDQANVGGTARRALVIGCGFGDDAEELARRGFDTTGFDVSQTAVTACRSRFPQTAVHYAVADLFAAPSEWERAFDLVVEAYTLQVLPVALRQAALGILPGFVRPGGLLLIIARGREPADPEGDMPWPLTREELRILNSPPLAEVEFADFLDGEDPPVRRFRAIYAR